MIIFEKKKEKHNYDNKPKLWDKNANIYFYLFGWYVIISTFKAIISTFPLTIMTFKIIIMNCQNMIFFLEWFS